MLTGFVSIKKLAPTRSRTYALGTKDIDAVKKITAQLARSGIALLRFDFTGLGSSKGKFQQVVQSGKHRMLADEPESYGGMDSGPSPYDFMAIALGACTGMTLRMYFDRKNIKIVRISVDVRHGKVHPEDCIECTHESKRRAGQIDRFERMISVEGGAPEELKEKILEIADKCPVHRTLETDSVVATVLSA